MAVLFILNKHFASWFDRFQAFNIIFDTAIKLPKIINIDYQKQL